MGNIISIKISGICGGSIDKVDDCASANEVERKLHTPNKKDEQQLLSPSPITVGTSDVVSDSSDMEDDETTSSFIGDISFDSLPLYEEPQAIVQKDVSDTVGIEKKVHSGSIGSAEGGSLPSDEPQAKNIQDVSQDDISFDSLPLYEEPQEVKQKDVSLEPDTQLSSVATVLLHHHLSNISDENEKLRKDNSNFESVTSMLSELILHVGDINDCYVIAELDITKGLIIDDKDAKVVEDEDGNITHRLFAVPFHQIPSEDLLGKNLIIRAKYSEGIPLSDLYDMTVSTSSGQKVGQSLGIQAFVHIGELDDEEETVNPTIQLAPNLSIQGSIYGLSEEDMDRFKSRNNEVGFVAQTIFEYVNDGTGLTDAEYAEFYPFSVTLGITPEVLKVLDALAPVCRDDMAEDEKKSPEKSTVSKDSDEYTALISNISEAVGCDDDQRKVLDENKKLVIESTALKALRDILGTIEIGNSSFKLEDGNLGVNTNEKLLWVFQADEEFTMAAKDIMKDGSVKLAGIKLNLSRDVLADQGSDLMMGIVLRYDNGIKVVGLFDSPVPALDNDFFTSDTLVKLGKVLFDFTIIMKVLDALDIDYQGRVGYYDGLPAYPDIA